MKRPVVRCRCGHQVLAKEVLRTDLYERPSGHEYVYVKYRCKRCKRVGETFVAENRWDWRIFEGARGELSEAETESFASQPAISSEDLLDFHQQLNEISTMGELSGSPAATPPVDASTPGARVDTFKATRPEPKRPEGDAKKAESKKDTEKSTRPDDSSRS